MDPPHTSLAFILKKKLKKNGPPSYFARIHSQKKLKKKAPPPHRAQNTPQKYPKKGTPQGSTPKKLLFVGPSFYSFISTFSVRISSPLF